MKPDSMETPAATSRRATKKRVRLDAEDRSEQIVRAAQKLFAERPYEAVSTADIAEAAGTTRTNIYHHFQTKSDLFLSIINRFTTIPDQLTDLPTSASVDDVVSEAFHRWLDTVDANREMFVTMSRARYSADPAVRGVHRASLEAWEPRLHQLLGTDPAQPRHRAMIRSYQAMVAEATAQWIQEGILEKSDVHSLLTQSLLAVKSALFDL